MATIDLTKDDFEKTVSDHDIVLVDFWAAWCGPCRQFAPVYAAASQAHPDIVFGKVDTEAESALSSAAGITSIPTLMAFREGVLVFSQPGALPATALEEVISGVKGLDMASIHEQVKRQRELTDQPLEVQVSDLSDALRAGRTVVDVREPGEYRAGHVSGALLMPLPSLSEHLDALPTGGPVYVICASGNRSKTATTMMRRAGVEAYSVAGGTSGWQQAGNPVVTGPYPTGAPAGQ